MDFWTSVYNHNWTKDSYQLAIDYIKYGSNSINNLKDDAKKLFRKRIKHGYNIDKSDAKKLILTTKEVPPFLNNSYVDKVFTFDVIHPDKIDDTINSFYEDEKNTALNYKTLHDKIQRAFHLGISRRNVEKFLKEHPRHLRQLRNVGKPGFIKSYRPLYPFQFWQIDHIDFQTLSTSNNKGYKFILVIIDIFSKFVYLYPTKSESAKETISVLQKLFLHGDIPEKIGADNKFNNNEFIAFNSQYHVKCIFGKPHNPQTQGHVERKNAHIKALIALHFNKYNTDRFYDILDHVSFTINNTKHSITNMTPIEIHRGRVIHMNPTPDEISINSNFVHQPCPTEKVDIQLYRKEAKEQHNQRVQLARNRIFKAADIREERFARERNKTFASGSSVLVSSYIKNSDKILPIQLSLVHKDVRIDLLNPLYFYPAGSQRRVQDRRHISDISEYSSTTFGMVLKSSRYKWSIKQAVKLRRSYGIIKLRKSSNLHFTVADEITNNGLRSYKLIYKENDITWNVERLIRMRSLADKASKYDEFFPPEILLKASSFDISNPANRPSYLPVQTVFNPTSFCEPTTVQPKKTTAVPKKTLDSVQPRVKSPPPTEEQLHKEAHDLFMEHEDKLRTKSHREKLQDIQIFYAKNKLVKKTVVDIVFYRATIKYFSMDTKYGTDGGFFCRWAKEAKENNEPWEDLLQLGSDLYTSEKPTQEGNWYFSNPIKAINALQHFKK